MWASIPICLWPSVWCSAWLAGLATTTAYRLPELIVPLAPHRLRTPLLSLHVSTLKMNPHAGLKKPYAMRALRLIPAQHDSEAS
jgi:hypothetical protein